MGDLEMQRLEAVAGAARGVRRAYDVDQTLGLLKWCVPLMTALCDALNVLDQGREIPEMEYDDGPWASTGSDSCIDVAGDWHFPGPDVTGSELPSEDEIKQGIRIRRLKQGFLVEPDFFTPQGKLAFTDAEDLAEWLLGWLGFEEGIVEGVREILAGLWDVDELVDRDYTRLLGVAEATQAYIHAAETFGKWAGKEYDRLVEAVNKWRGIEGK